MVSMLAVAAASWGSSWPSPRSSRSGASVTTARQRTYHSATWPVQPGFGLWVAYGLAIGDLALVIPNALAFLVGMTTIAAAVHYRQAAARTA